MECEAVWCVPSKAGKECTSMHGNSAAVAAVAAGSNTEANGARGTCC